MRFFSKNFKGFMIVETIVAVALIAFAIVGPFSTARSSLTAATDARDYLESVYLADEAIEYVRMVRDNNIFLWNGDGNHWLDGLSNCVGANASCGISATEAMSGNNPRVCADSLNCELSFDPSTGKYTHQTGGVWVPSGIKRQINIVQTVVGQEAKVTVTIKRNRLNYPERVYTTRSILFNWKQQISP